MKASFACWMFVALICAGPWARPAAGQVLIFNNPPAVPMGDQEEIKDKFRGGKVAEAAQVAAGEIWKLSEYLAEHGNKRPGFRTTKTPTSYLAMARWRDFLRDVPVGAETWLVLEQRHGADKTDDTQIKLALAAHLLGKEAFASAGFREWLKAHPQDALVTLLVVERLMMEEHGIEEAVALLGRLPGDAWREAVPDWVRALSLYDGVEHATGLGRLAAAWLQSQPAAYAAYWTHEVLDNLVKERWEDRRSYPGLLKRPQDPVRQVEPGHEPVAELQLARELAYDELREAMRKCAVTAPHVLPILAREDYLADRDTEVWAKEALTALNTLRAEPEYAGHYFLQGQSGPWEEYDRAGYQCPNVAELLIHAAFKRGRSEWLQDEVLPVLKDLYGTSYALIEARALLFTCDPSQFVEKAREYHAIRTRNTSPKQELTLEHLQPVLEVMRKRKLGAEEDLLVKEALRLEMARDRNFNTSLLESHALALEAARGEGAAKTYLHDLVAAAAVQDATLMAGREVLEMLARHESLYFPLLTACYEQGLGGQPAVDQCIERIRSNLKVRDDPSGLLARSPFLRPAATLQPFLKRDQSVSALAYLGMLIRDSPKAKSITAALEQRFNKEPLFGLRLLLASIDKAHAEPVKHLYPAAAEFAALSAEKRRALWPAMTRAFPDLEKTQEAGRPAVFDELKAERRAAFAKGVLEAQDLQSLRLSPPSFEQQFTEVLRELAVADPALMKRVYIRGVELALAHQQVNGWWRYTGDGWTLPCMLLEDVTLLRRGDNRPLGSNPFRTLALDLLTDPAQRTYFLKAEPWHLQWHRGLEAAFDEAGGAGDPRKGFRAMIQVMAHPQAQGAALVAASHFHQLVARQFSPWQIMAMRDEARALAGEAPALRPLCEVFDMESVLAGLDFYQPWGASPDDAAMVGIRNAWEGVARLVQDEGINPLLRLSYACHRARADGRFLNPSAVLSGMRLLQEALQKEWPVSGNSLAPLVHAFLHLPRDAAWREVAQGFRSAWLERLKNDRKDASRGGGFWPQETMLSASVALFAAESDLEGIKRLWGLEGNEGQHPAVFGQELARAGLFAEALQYVRPAVAMENLSSSVGWPVEAADGETLRRLDQQTHLAPADHHALKVMLARLRNPSFGIGRAVPLPLWEERSGALARDFIKLNSTDPGLLRHCLWTAEAVQVLAPWAKRQVVPADWAGKLWDQRRDWQGPALDRLYVPLILALDAALEGDAAPWRQVQEELKSAWAKDEARGAKVYREVGRAACWPSINYILGREPEDIRRVLPVLRGYVKSLPHPTGSGIEGCCLTLQLALSALLEDSDKVMNATWSEMPAKKQEVFQGMDLGLAWPSALAAASTAKGPCDEKRPLEVRLRIVTKLAAHPALRGHLQRTPTALRQLMSVGVLTAPEVREHAEELARCAPGAGWLMELASVLDDGGDAAPVVNLLTRNLEASPAAEDPWTMLGLGAFAAEQGLWNAALELASQMLPASPGTDVASLHEQRIEAGRKALMERIQHSGR